MADDVVDRVTSDLVDEVAINAIDKVTGVVVEEVAIDIVAVNVVYDVVVVLLP